MNLDRRTSVASMGIAATLLTFAAAAQWSASLPSEGIDPGGLGIGLLAVALGALVLEVLRRNDERFSPPQVMLLLGFAGMSLGLRMDLDRVPAETISGLCTAQGRAGYRGLIDAFLLHVQLLPWMHAGMAAGGLLAIPVLRRMRGKCRRYLCSLFAQNLMCSAWMLVGMTTGALLLSRWQVVGSESPLADMIGGMFAGMTWGMVVSVALYRTYFRSRDAWFGVSPGVARRRSGTGPG